MSTSAGRLDPPLGNARLQLVRLLASLLLTNTPALNTALAQLGTLSTILVSEMFSYTVGGDGGCRVSEIRAGTTSPMPDHKGFKLQ